MPLQQGEILPTQLNVSDTLSYGWWQVEVLLTSEKKGIGIVLSF